MIYTSEKCIRKVQLSQLIQNVRENFGIFAAFCIGHGKIMEGLPFMRFEIKTVGSVRSLWYLVDHSLPN